MIFSIKGKLKRFLQCRSCKKFFSVSLEYDADKVTEKLDCWFCLSCCKGLLEVLLNHIPDHEYQRNIQ